MPGNGFTTTRHRFRHWRRTRPFWAGLLTLLASLPTMYFPYAHISLSGLALVLPTTTGAGSLLIAVLLVVLGVTMWCQPQVRVFAGTAAIVLAVVSFPVSNFGGFLLGLVPGLVGGSLACSWAPGSRVMDDPDSRLPVGAEVNRG
ncbi:MAG: hypothetical protein JO362_14435 [Streptomycetaceae bacterium]|nr:hypothetical protein [Streptomycetaceae bacterium]